VVVGDALIGHRFQDVLQHVVRAAGDRLTKAVFAALVYAGFWQRASTLVFIHRSAWRDCMKSSWRMPRWWLFGSTKHQNRAL
jgi:hypothetical protein